MFIAHKNDIPKDTAHALEYFGKTKMASNNGREVLLINNICPHQQMLINHKHQHEQLVCPYHGRRWDMSGDPHSPGECKLDRQRTYEQCGLLFDVPTDFGSVFAIPTDFKRQSFHRQRVNASRNAIMDVFLDVDHVSHAHKNVYESIGITENMSVAWVFKDWGSIQIVTEQQAVRAVWIAQYPGTMIEWQPGALFITQCIPSYNTEYTDVQILQYKGEESTSESFFHNKNIWDKAWEQDVMLAEHHRRPCGLTTGEEGKDHFREWINGNK